MTRDNPRSGFECELEPTGAAERLDGATGCPVRRPDRRVRRVGAPDGPVLPVPAAAVEGVS